MAIERTQQTADEDACAKFWEIYANEAQRYDEGVIRSWKEDMDVTLVFSGLYSAVVTAFVIQSYQVLQEDPADTSATYLRHIALQLSGEQNITKLPLDNAFKPSTSSVVCNVLWFLSLTLALACAFLATFVQQWARHFLHRTTIIRSPINRARLLQFLYFGLKEMRMHTIVEVTPSLLHTSLFLFLGGLVAFLYPVNHAITWLMLSMMVLMGVVYIILTILPAIKLNSPYQTPLSSIIWRSWTWLQPLLMKTPQGFLHISILRRSKDLEDGPDIRLDNVPKPDLPPSNTSEVYAPDTLVNAMLLRSRRGAIKYESTSAVWTLRSITDDTELLPVVEALCEALYGIDGLRTQNLHLVHPLLMTVDSQANIIHRTYTLFMNSSQDRFNENHEKRCRTACLNLFWILAVVLLRAPPTTPVGGSTSQTQLCDHFPPTILQSLADVVLHAPSSDTSASANSALAACMLQVYTSFRSLLTSSGVGDLSAQQYLDCYMVPNWQDSPSSGSESLVKANFLGEAEKRLSYVFSHFLKNECKFFPSEIESTVYLFDHCHIRILESHVVTIYWELTEQYLAIPSADAATKRSTDVLSPRIQRLDVIFKIVWNNSAILSDAPEADPTGYLTKRIRSSGWMTTRSIWGDPVTWDKDFFSRLEFLQRMWPADDEPIIVLQEILLCQGTTPHYNNYRVVFWTLILEHLHNLEQIHYSDLHRQLAFCIRIMAEVGVANGSTHFADLEQIVAGARHHIGADEAIVTLVPDMGSRRKEDSIHPWLLLQFLGGLNLQYSIPILNDGLRFYCRMQKDERLPGSMRLMVSLPACGGGFARHTKLITQLWTDTRNPLLVESLILLFDLWWIVVGYMSNFHRDPALATQFLPTVEAADMILSPESKDAINTIQKSVGWEGSVKKFNQSGIPWSGFISWVQHIRAKINENLPDDIRLPPDDDIGYLG